jgi:hypothetical protein
MVLERRWLVVLCLLALLALVVPFGKPPSSVRAQAACAELISDGGFETGGAWQLSAGPVAPDYISYQKHGDGRALRLGIDDSQNVTGSSSARQTITIPGSATDVSLSFWSYTVFTGPPGGDLAELDLLAPDGYTILDRLWSADSDSRVWSESSIDLTRWRGNTVQIYFTVFNDGQGSTAGMYLDDVSVQACPADATASQTPVSGATPTPGATPSQTPVDHVASPTATATVIPVADTATPGAPSPGVPPAACMDLLQNGGFEQMAAGWIPGRDPVPVQITGTPVHSGSYSLKLGEDAANVLSYSSARQPVTIPAGYGQVLLNFWTWTWTDDTGSSDRQEADFLSAGGLVLQKFWRVTVNDRAWMEHIIPVTSYAGQTVQVYFNVFNDGSGSRAGMYLDDVHLWACPYQVAQPAGQPNATALPSAGTPSASAATLTPVAGAPIDAGATVTIAQAGPAVTVIVIGGQPTTVALAGSPATPTTGPTATPVVAQLAPTAAAQATAPGLASALTAAPAGAALTAPAGLLAGPVSWLAENWPKPWWMPITVIAALIVVLILMRAILLGSAYPP